MRWRPVSANEPAQHMRVLVLVRGHDEPEIAARCDDGWYGRRAYNDSEIEGWQPHPSRTG